MNQRRFILLILALILLSVGWGFLITSWAWGRVMKQPFFVAGDRFVLFFPVPPIRDKVEVKIGVSREFGGTDQACVVTLDWPESLLDIKLDVNPYGMPKVGDDEALDMFYAQGLERQLRLVRQKMVAAWEAKAMQTNAPNDLCTGANNDYWAAIKATEKDKWAVRVQTVGDTASSKFAEIVRERFDDLIREAARAWITWVIAFPVGVVLLVVITALFWP